MKKQILMGLAASLFSLQAQAALSVKELNQGKVDITFVQAKPKPYLKTRGILNASVNQSWKAITDFQNYTRYFESITKSEVKSIKGNQAKVYVEFQFPWPVGKVWVLNQYTMDPSRKKLSWIMLDGNLKDSDGAGSWQFQPYKNKTLATYTLNLDGGNQWVKKQALYQSIPGVFSYLNRQIK